MHIVNEDSPAAGKPPEAIIDSHCYNRIVHRLQHGRLAVCTFD